MPIQGIDVKSLGHARLVICGLLTGTLGLDLVALAGFYRAPTAVYFPTPLVHEVAATPPPVAAITIVGLIGCLSLLSAAIGQFARASLLLSAASFFFVHLVLLGFTKPRPSTTYVSHFSNIVPLVLLVLAFAPGIGKWRPRRPLPKCDSESHRPVRLVVFILAMVYFGGGVAKLRSAGTSWASSESLQTIFVGRHLRLDNNLAWSIAQRPNVANLLGVATIVFELCFVFAVWAVPRSRAKWIFAATGLGFHIGTGITMGIWHFLPYLAPIYAVFLVKPATSDLRPTREHSMRFLSIAIPALMIGAILTGVERWPISDFGVFRHEQQLEHVSADIVILTMEDGTRRPVTHDGRGFAFLWHIDASSFTRYWFASSESETRLAAAEADELKLVLQNYWNELPSGLTSGSQSIELVHRRLAGDGTRFEVVETILARVDSR